VANDRVSKGKEWYLALMVSGIALVYVVGEYGPFAWAWLTEDLGARLRRECETVVREAHPNVSTEDLREFYIRSCIDARAKVVR
jgi:hypothetical protein